MERNRLILLALGAQAIWLAGILGAPYAASIGYDGVAERLYAAYRPFCHQKAERSLFIFGGQMTVCARCFGIYAGTVIGSVAAAIVVIIRGEVRLVNIRVVGVSLFPLAVDGLTQLAGLRESSTPLRMATGLLFGSVFAYYFLPLVISRLERSS
jgi:uncharacterized membrane protein